MTQESVRVKKHEKPSFTQRPFFKLATSALIALNFTFGTPLMLPKLFSAQAQEQVQVEGKLLNLVKLDRPLADLEKATGRQDESFPDSSVFKQYQNMVKAPGVNFLVTINHPKRILNLTVVFPKNLENNPNEAGAGTRSADLAEFAGLVTACTGKTLERVKIITESGTFDNKGVQTPYTNAYVVPVDPAGKAITCLGEGKYLIYGVTYYGDYVCSNPMVLAEPTDKYTLQIAIASR